MLVPKMIPETTKSRKMWKVDSSIPFKTATPPPRQPSLSPSPPPSTPSSIEETPAEELRNLAIQNRQKNWLEVLGSILYLRM